MRQWIGLASLAVAMTASAQTGGAAPPSELQVAQWAVSCMACHGTDGHAEGAAMTLSGRKADELAELLLAYKSGRRQGTIMPAHAKGYSDAELRHIAQYFARVGTRSTKP